MSDGQNPPPTGPKEDPWEARERERARWRRNSKDRGRSSTPRQRSSRSSSASEGPSDETIAASAEDSGFKADYVAWGLIATLCILLFSEVPSIGSSNREIFARIGTGAIFLLVGIARDFRERLWDAAKRWPNPLILLLAAWAVFEVFNSPFRGYATTDLLRIFDGIGAYFLCAYCLRAPRQTGLMVAGLLAIGVTISLLDLSRTGGAQGGVQDVINLDYSVLGTHENVGSLLMLLLPIALSFAVSAGVEEKRRLSALAATLVLGAALLAARPRAAWVGSFIALIVLGALSLRYQNSGSDGDNPDSRRGRRNRIQQLIESPILLLAGAMFLFVIFAGAAPIVQHRLASFNGFLHDGSFTGRTQMWSGAVRMASEKPVDGWGLGAFQVIEGRWTHSGSEIPVALSLGVGDENMAHNYYFQWAADTGGIGLFLYVGVIVALLWSACRAVPRVTSPQQRALLCGSVAAVSGGVVDALASPAYYFHGISTLFWCCMGLAVAATRPLGRSSKSAAAPTPGGEQALERTPARVWIGSTVIAAAVVFMVLGSGYTIRRRGATAPRGRLEIAMEPNLGPVLPGETIHWTAFFHDGNGVEQPTMPGTMWILSSTQPGSIDHVKRSLTEWSPRPYAMRHEIINVVAPPMDGTLTMEIRYADSYGRWYTAYSMQQVERKRAAAKTGRAGVK